MSFTVKEILKATGGDLASGKGNAVVKDISTDSRRIKKGELFVALKGENFDGHRFVEEALDKGAAGAIVSNKVNIQQTRVIARDEVPKQSQDCFAYARNDVLTEYLIIRVKNTLRALGDIAHFHRMRFKIPLIAITGSNGKTTTKELITHILSQKLRILKNEGTENNAVGLPLTLLKLNPSVEAAVVELGSNHKGEIAELSRIAAPTIGVITNIGPAHLKYFGSLKQVTKEKCSILAFLKNGRAVLNGDDTRLQAEVKKFGLKKRPVLFGLDKTSVTGLRKLSLSAGRSRFILSERNDEYAVRLRLLGKHNLYNALAAMAVCRQLKLDEAAIAAGLNSFRPPRMRMEPLRAGKLLIVNDSYNANPYSFACAIETFCGLEVKGRRVLICGDMLELGRHQRREHCRLGELIAKTNIDWLITYGNGAKWIARAAVSKGFRKKRVKSYLRKKSVVNQLKRIATEKDALLFKASRAMKMEDIIRCFITSYTR